MARRQEKGIQFKNDKSPKSIFVVTNTQHCHSVKTILIKPINLFACWLLLLEKINRSPNVIPIIKEIRLPMAAAV